MNTATDELKKLEKRIHRTVRKTLSRRLNGYVIMCWKHISQFEASTAPDETKITKTFSHAVDVENVWLLQNPQGRCLILLATDKQDLPGS